MVLLAINEFEQILLYSAIGITVVFVALIILVIAFKVMGNMSKKSLKKLTKKNTHPDKTSETVHEKELTGQEVAAISMALHLFLSDIHDQESNIITIKRIERRYSPWNSKIYGLTNIIR
ncbi:MAG: OadG family protein [Paludibacter sp.]|nr:OadG family protein [Paludibacter sp.]